MRYGQPSTVAVVHELIKHGARRIIVVPMYPQYSASTTASALDGLFAALQRVRVVPALRIVSEFHAEPRYIDAVAGGIERSVKAAFAPSARPERFLLSFHGVPQAYINRGDPYLDQSKATARLIADRMGWRDEDWLLTFQSRLGPVEWIGPFTDETIKRLGASGAKSIVVATPGFTADCLETIDEIGVEALETFRHAGGERLIRVPCVNDDAAFIEALRGLVEKEAAGWR
jgi:ferrochelatase